MSLATIALKFAKILPSGMLAIAVLTGSSPQSSAASTQGPYADPEAIHAAIEDAINQAAPQLPETTLAVEFQPADPGLHLAQCLNLAVTLPPLTGNHITAKVSCPNPAWAVYVPVQLHRWRMVMVAATALMPGRPLSASDLTPARIDTAALPGTPITDVDDALGKLLRTNVQAGTPVLVAQLEAPLVIHRDQRVVVTLEDGNLVVKTVAVAQQDGHQGDVIMLQNPSSKKTLRATVTGNGEAAMQL